MALLNCFFKPANDILLVTNPLPNKHALHNSGFTPTWQTSVWRHTLSAVLVFVFCIKHVLRQSKYYYKNVLIFISIFILFLDKDSIQNCLLQKKAGRFARDSKCAPLKLPKFNDIIISCFKNSLQNIEGKFFLAKHLLVLWQDGWKELKRDSLQWVSADAASFGLDSERVKKNMENEAQSDRLVTTHALH